MSSSQTLPPPEGPEYTPCACSHIEPEHDINGRWCAVDGCECSLYRPTPAAPAAAPRPVQHAPGKAILCPSCRGKGHSVCMAEQPAPSQQPEEADNDPRRELIARAIWDRQHPVDDWDTTRDPWKADCLADADAVLAVLPAPADRADVLREVADRYQGFIDNADTGADPRYWTGVRDMVIGLRHLVDEERDEQQAQANLDQLADELPRMADEAQQPETEVPEPVNELTARIAATKQKPAFRELAKALDAPVDISLVCAAVYRELADEAAEWGGVITEQELRRMAREAERPAPLRAELKPWQLLADQPDEPLPQTERLVGGRRLAADSPSRMDDETQQPETVPWGVCPDCRATAGPDCDCLAGDDS